MASNFAIRFAAHQIRHGGVIVYPTETVYGIGCNPMNAEAVSHLCALKNRDISKGLIILASDISLLEDYIKPLTPDEIETIKRADRPTSWVVPAKNNTPAWLTGKRSTLVIRITKNPVVSKLCSLLNHPLVSSSANPGGHKPASNAMQLHNYFQHKVDAILVSNEPRRGQPSVIRQLGTGEILRC